MKICSILIALLLIGGFFGYHLLSHKSIEYYEGKTPKIDVRTFFNGDLEGWGTFFDYSGSPTSHFTIRLKGTWVNDKGILEEWFEFDNGRKLERKWDLSMTDDKHFVGKASDVIGDAHGTQMGNAIHSLYTLQISPTLKLFMDDWIYEVAPGVVLNRVKLKKFGIPVGEMVIVMKKK